MARNLVLVGGGLASGLIALRLARARPDVAVTILEAGDRLGGNHTWSFHETDVTEAQLAWLEPLIAHRWATHEVRFPWGRRSLDGGYFSITSDRLHDVLTGFPSLDIRLGARARDVGPTHAVLEGGERLSAGAVIDGRGDPRSPAMEIRFQKFIGQEVELAAPHGLAGPIIMDGTVEQIDGFRFIYVLPLAEDRLLVEDTYYSDGGEVLAADLRRRITDYAAGQGWRIARLVREEQGALPIVLAGDIRQFWEEGDAGVPRCGMRAGLFHPTTGYSVPDAVRLADLIAAAADLSADPIYRLTRNFSEATWRRHQFSRMLSRLLFLAARPEQRIDVMARFYRLDAGLIARFYAGSTTLADRMRVLVGRPPVSIFRALKALPARAATARPATRPAAGPASR